MCSKLKNDVKKNKGYDNNMIDMHTHILPNIDDGARNIEESLNLIDEAQRVGFESVILTSHYIEGYYETDKKESQVLTDSILQNLNKKGINIKLYFGNEIYISENIIELLKEGKASTINNTSYALFEMPRNAKPLNLYDIIYKMQQYKVIPILAHPERYSFIQEKPELVYDLIQKGVLMQANYGSVIGQYGSKAQFTLKILLENNMIHFLGTDVHRQNTIYPRIPKILNELRKIIGEQNIEKLTTINPKMALNNEKIEISEPQQINLSFKEKVKMFFWH